MRVLIFMYKELLHCGSVTSLMTVRIEPHLFLLFLLQSSVVYLASTLGKAKEQLLLTSEKRGGGSETNLKDSGKPFQPSAVTVSAKTEAGIQLPSPQCVLTLKSKPVSYSKVT